MNQKRRPRKWLRFSLASFLLLVTAFSIWFGALANRARKQRSAVGAVEALGGVIHFDYQIDAWGRYDEKAIPPGPDWIRSVIGDDFFRKVIVLDFSYGSRFPKGESKIGDEDLALLAGLADIKNLEVGRNAITDDGLVHLRHLSKLEIRYLYRMLVSGNGDGVKYLANCRRLTSLSLANTPLNDNGLEHIGRLQQLEWLRLNCTLISDKGVASLAGLANLKDLSLSAMDITDDALDHLTGLTILRSLALSGTHVTAEGVARLQSELPGCRIATSFGLGKVPHEVQLWEEEYSPSKHELMTACKEFGFHFGPASEDGGLETITSLSVRDSLVSEETVIQALQHCPRLEFVSFNKVLFGDEVVARLKHLEQLRRLDVRNCPLSDFGVESFRAMKNLRELNIQGTSITDDCIDDLLQMTNLEMLDVGNTRVTVDGMQRLHKGLPNCQISW